VFGGGQQQPGQALIAEDIEDEAGENERGEDSGGIKDAAQSLPTLALGVEKYLSIRHERSCSFYVLGNR
jgi:hypothetical protein